MNKNKMLSGILLSLLVISGCNKGGDSSSVTSSNITSSSESISSIIESSSSSISYEYNLEKVTNITYEDGVLKPKIKLLVSFAPLLKSLSKIATNKGVVETIRLTFEAFE